MRELCTIRMVLRPSTLLFMDITSVELKWKGVFCMRYTNCWSHMWWVCVANTQDHHQEIGLPHSAQHNMHQADKHKQAWCLLLSLSSSGREFFVSIRLLVLNQTGEQSSKLCMMPAWKLSRSWVGRVKLSRSSKDCLSCEHGDACHLFQVAAW